MGPKLMVTLNHVKHIPTESCSFPLIQKLWKSTNMHN